MYAELMRFTLSSDEVSPLLVLAFVVAAICLFPNWDLVTLARQEGIDSLSGGRGIIVYIGLGAALFFVVNLALFIIQSAFRHSEYRSVEREIESATRSAIAEQEEEQVVRVSREALEALKNFEGADLKGADLRGGNLQGGNFSGANLSMAALSGANLNLADLTGAHIT